MKAGRVGMLEKLMMCFRLPKNEEAWVVCLLCHQDGGGGDLHGGSGSMLVSSQLA